MIISDTGISPTDHADHFYRILHGADSHRHETKEHRSCLGLTAGDGPYRVPWGE